MSEIYAIKMMHGFLATVKAQGERGRPDGQDQTRVARQ
jgi:hypothetical protein